MRFKKIKVKDAKVNLEYEVLKGSSWDEFALLSNDKAQPAFYNALQAMAIDLTEMCELPADYVEKILVTGVSFSYAGERETMGATIIGQMKLKKSNVNLNLNTPHKIVDFYAESGDPFQLLSDGCRTRLSELIEEAKNYVKGIREQAELFRGEAA